MAAAASPVLVTLGQLRPGSEAKPPVNIRATDPAAPDIATLAANIADRLRAGDRPLIEPLVVVEGPKPRGGARLYYVCNGGRRLAALTRLLGQGIVTEALELPIILLAKGAGLEASTTAAVTAAPHHPVEQFEAFAQVAADRPEAERIGYIARRFGLAERRVRQVLALGNLSPAVRQAWRAGKINQETAQAFAVEPDQEKQAQLLEQLSHRMGHLSPYEVRSALTRDRMRSTDSYVGFVGLQAYLAAGGTLTGDLFTEDRYIADTALLDRLVAEKREAITADLMAEGWGWVFWVGTPEAADYWQWPRDHREAVWTPETKAELERLQAELAAIDASGQARLAAQDDEDDIHDEDAFPADDDDAEVYGDDEPGDAPADTLAAQRQDLVIQIKRLKDGAERAAWSREEKANFAVVVGWRDLVGLWTGGGYTPPALQPPASGDTAAGDAGEAADTPSANEPPPPPETAELPRAARQSLSLVANRAAAATLAGDAHLAMALLAAAWIIRSNRISGTDVSYTSANQVPLIVSDQGLGHGPDLAQRKTKDNPRPTFAALAAELVSGPRGQVHETLAKLVAGALDLTNDTLENRNTYAGQKGVSPAGAAAFLAALPGHVFEKNAQLILSQEADALFADWPKAALVAAVKEMDGEEAAAQAAKAKKGNLVALVAERAKATGWLPEALRLTPWTEDSFGEEVEPVMEAGDDGADVEEAA